MHRNLFIKSYSSQLVNSITHTVDGTIHWFGDIPVVFVDILVGSVDIHIVFWLWFYVGPFSQVQPVIECLRVNLPSRSTVITLSKISAEIS